MANETTYALISSLVNPIWEAALMYAQQNFFMPALVTGFNDFNGMQDRKITQYAAGTVITALGETTDLTAQALARSLLATLTPAEVGTMYMLLDRRKDSDPEDVAADIAQKVGYEIFLQVEKDLLGDMASFTAGTVGFAGSALNWTRVYAARAKLAANAIPGPYVCVLHEYQYYQLAVAANVAGLANAAPLKIRDDIQSRYYVGSTSDIDFYTTGVLTAGTAVKGGLFARQAIAYDLRRGFRIEPQRDASMRGTELNATMIYAHGLWRADFGVTILADASVPNP
jgi:hypothetical protein